MTPSFPYSPPFLPRDYIHTPSCLDDCISRWGVASNGQRPTVEDVSFRIKENAAAELYLSDGDEVVVKDVDEKGDVSSHVVRIVDGDPSELFEMDGAALKIRPREWLYKLLGVGGWGVKQHDIVRDFAIAALGPAKLRRHQRMMVRLLLSQTPERGWHALT